MISQVHRHRLASLIPACQSRRAAFVLQSTAFTVPDDPGGNGHDGDKGEDDDESTVNVLLSDAVVVALNVQAFVVDVSRGCSDSSESAFFVFDNLLRGSYLPGL